MANVWTRPNLGRRILAGLIDYFVIYVFYLVFVYVFGKPIKEEEYALAGILLILPLTIWLIFTVGFEVWLGGTLGNSMMGLKAIPKNGERRNLIFGESFLRHLVDFLDMSFFGIVGIILITNTRSNQRLGDMLGGTIVVRVKS